MAKNLKSAFKIIRNGSEKYWREIIQKLVDEGKLNYSFYDYKINQKSLDYTAYFAIEKESDKVVGVTALTKWPLLQNNRILSIGGTFYVLPEYRSRKIGLWLTKETLKDSTGDNCLTSVPALWEKCRDHLGLEKLPSYTTRIFWANCSTLKPENLRVDTRLKICDWREADFKKICAYDSKISACERSAYLANTFAHPGSITKVAFNSEDELVGFCRIRLLINNHVDVGPFYANDSNVAESLLGRCAESFLNEFSVELNENSQIFYKAPSTNADAEKLFATLIDGAKYKMRFVINQFNREPLELPVKFVFSRSEASSVTTI